MIMKKVNLFLVISITVSVLVGHTSCNAQARVDKVDKKGRKIIDSSSIITVNQNNYIGDEWLYGEWVGTHDGETGIFTIYQNGKFKTMDMDDDSFVFYNVHEDYIVLFEYDEKDKSASKIYIKTNDSIKHLCIHFDENAEITLNKIKDYPYNPSVNMYEWVVGEWHNVNLEDEIHELFYIQFEKDGNGTVAVINNYIPCKYKIEKNTGKIYLTGDFNSLSKDNLIADLKTKRLYYNGKQLEKRSN